MTDRKLFVHLVKVGDGQFEIAGLSEDKVLWMQLPPEEVNLELHTVLSNYATIKAAMSAIKPLKGFRKVGVKIDNKLKNIYFDDAENLCYKKLPLEEITTDPPIEKKEEEVNYLRRIQELEQQLEDKGTKLEQIEKKFIINKFDRKQNITAKEWMSRFEGECDRNHILIDSKKIQALRFFVDGIPKDWYESNLQKIGLQDWSEWKRIFFTVFEDKGWSTVRKAFAYKYYAGSLIDYAVAKERLALEVNPKGLELARLQMIVVGLPSEIQDKIDREEVNTIEKLFNELRKLDEAYNNQIKKENATNLKKKSAPVFQQKIQTVSNLNRSPCYMCEALGWPNRYHLTADCRNKEKYVTKLKTNLTECTEEDKSILNIISEN